MSLQTLSQEILADAKSQSEQCKSAVLQEIAAKESKTQEELEAFRVMQRQLYEKELELAEKQILGTYHLQAKEILRSAQSKLLQEIKSDVLTNVRADQGKTKVALLNKCIELANESIKFTSVLAPLADVTILKKLTNANVAAKPSNDEITFVAQNAKESVTFSYEELVTSVIENQEKELYEELF